MITAIAIDDEIPALQIIEIFCKSLSNVALQKTFNKPTDALKYLNKYPVDLVFLDINMPSLNGIELLNNVKQETMVIFTTAYSHYAVEGFNLNAVDFLLKPFSFERFQQAVKKAEDQLLLQKQKAEITEPGFIYIRADYRLIKIDLKDILFIESLDDYLKIHLDQQKPVVARMTMKNIMEKLPSPRFVRIHRSYIVALEKITSTRGKLVTVGEQDLPIGNSFEVDFLKSFKA
jgi:DNA-binding LytR/AlgR family response regulator